MHLNKQMRKLFEHPVFLEAIGDIESLGVKVTTQPIPGAAPYAVVGGRSNARWWLIPLETGRQAASGLAMFQPLLPSARAIKATTVFLCRIGLSRLWARNIVYITGEPALAKYFPGNQGLSFAYFTGTDSPHRKIAVQIMDQLGNLKGFAKFSRNPAVCRLIEHESAILNQLQHLNLQTAHIPNVLYSGRHGGGTLLITDTLKTSKTRSTTNFSATHQAFLEEIKQKTTTIQQPPIGQIAKDFRQRFNCISDSLNHVWRQRLDQAINTLEAQADLLLPTSLCHGDFTPWNTFVTNGRLYVFDWEYAEPALPASNDLIHFALNEPATRSQPACIKIEAVIACLSQHWTGFRKQTFPALLTIYLLTDNLRHIERLPKANKPIQTWDGSEDAAAIIDGFSVSIASNQESRFHLYSVESVDA